MLTGPIKETQKDKGIYYFLIFLKKNEEIIKKKYNFSKPN